MGLLYSLKIILTDYRDRQNIQGLKFQMDFLNFKQNIAELVRQNQIMEGNIKFLLFVKEDNIHWVFSFISHNYPASEDYQSGILTDLFFAERPNPNAKVIRPGIRDEADRMIFERKLYEVLLVDRDGMITEGSRSNVFFVKSNVISYRISFDDLRGNYSSKGTLLSERARV